MALEQEYFDTIHKLDKHKSNPNLIEFFDSIGKIEKLVEEMDASSKITALDRSKLDKRARTLTKELKSKKDEIATRTKTQKEYDAVYECIEYLHKHFNK